MLQKFIASAGIILAIASANLVLSENVLGLAMAQRTNTTVPTRDILAKLKPSAQVPIFLPSRLPFSNRVYYNSQTTETGYTVDFNLTPNCQGTPCYIGSISAEKGGQLVTREPGLTREFKNIRLARGTGGVFHNGCGAYCTASVEWQSQGVLYRVSLKNGLEADAIQIANSAIEAGRR